MRDAEHSDAILANCRRYCDRAITTGQYASISLVLSFIHKANSDDAWLLSSSSAILPHLNTMYVKILATTDPNKLTTSPGRMNIAISSKVRENKDALHALCRIFELVIDFCDIDTKDTQCHLETFLTSSSAVLFGSNFQKERNALNATEYAMDELARFSSFALSNVLLTYPAIVPAADRLLGKRCAGLFNYLYLSAELSVQKSILLILRILYQHTCKTEASPRNLKSRIENGLSTTRFGNGSALGPFKSLNPSADDFEEQCESILTKLFEATPIDSRCFKTENCTVRMKGKVNGSLKKGGAQKASVAWNKNSIAVQVRNQPLAHFPLYTIVGMKWLNGRKEVQLRYKTDCEEKDNQLAIQFKASCNRGYLGRAIEGRIQHYITQIGYEEEPAPERKMSTVMCPVKDEDERVAEERSMDESESEKEDEVLGEEGNTVIDEARDGDEMEEEYAVGECEREKECTVAPPPFCGPAEDTVFSALAADGVLLVEDGEAGGDGKGKRLLADVLNCQKEGQNDADVPSKPDPRPGGRNWELGMDGYVENLGDNAEEKEESAERRGANGSEVEKVPDVIQIEDSASEKEETGEQEEEAAEWRDPLWTVSSDQNEEIGVSQQEGIEKMDAGGADMRENEQDGKKGEAGCDIEDVEMKANEEEGKLRIVGFEGDDGDGAKDCRGLDGGEEAMEEVSVYEADEELADGGSEEETGDGGEENGEEFCGEDEKMRVKLLSAVRGVIKVRFLGLPHTFIRANM